MNLNIVVILFLIVGLFSCNGDSCDGLVEGPDIRIAENTKSYISNYLENSKIIFQDLATNQEVEFAIDTIDSKFNSYSGIGVCPEDPVFRATVNGVSETIKVTLSNSELDESIVYVLNQSVDPVILQDATRTAGWEILIQYGTIDDTPTSAENLLLLELNNQDFYTATETLSIGGISFFDVREMDANNPGFEVSDNPTLEVKLTRDEGIVYINDLINNRELVYLRVE